ncbi:uncharacterized protein [Narcine bancroftii]
MELIKSTARTASGNTVSGTDLDSITSLAPTLSPDNGTVFNNSLENSTVNALTRHAELTKNHQMATTVVDDAPQAGNETQDRVGKLTASPPSLDTKVVTVTVSPNITKGSSRATEPEPAAETTSVPLQMWTTAEMYSTAPELRPETTAEPKNASLAPFAGHEESKELPNNTVTANSETLPVLSTLRESKTTTVTMTSNGRAWISTTAEATPTSRPRTTPATVKTVATSIAIINKATTLYSTHQSEGNDINAKKMVNGRWQTRLGPSLQHQLQPESATPFLTSSVVPSASKKSTCCPSVLGAGTMGKPISNSSQSKVDPLVIGMITVFFIIVGIISLLGFLKYRQRINQPEFRRLHELPMDDMMEEDTPLSLYSY